MNYSTIMVTQNKDVATVALHRPEVHNAFNEKVIEELIKCFRSLSNDQSIRVIVLTGTGKSFCAGADLSWMKSMVHFSKEENRRDSQQILQLYESIYECPKPVIGRINGNAFGGGVGLVAVCDISIASSGALFAFSEVKLGIIPAVISSFVAARLSPAVMQRLFITGERFDAEYAVKIGLIDYVVDTHLLDEKVQLYVDVLRSSGPEAIKEVKNLIRSMRQMDQSSYKMFTVEKITQLRVSPEGQEGITAFLEKRKSKWSE
ncbi:MAG: enoyl-CoA hydratase/isomerase family protein [Candidatus Thermoplasmatota archaeon]